MEEVWVKIEICQGRMLIFDRLYDERIDREEKGEENEES